MDQSPHLIFDSAKSILAAWSYAFLPCKFKGRSSPDSGISTKVVIVVVQSLSCVQIFLAPWTAACQASLFFTLSQSWLKLMSIKSVMPSNHLILCHPLLLLLSFFPSIRVFSSESFKSGGQSIRASASVLPMNIQDWLLGLINLGLIGLTSLLSKGLWRVFYNTTVWKHQFFGTQPSLWPHSHIHTWLLEKP